MADCYVWCTDCGVRLTKDEIKGWGCPKCGNQGVPCDPKQDVLVEINWHELHVLCCWAERWAQRCAETDPDPKSKKLPRTVYAIAARLEQQWPELGALTLGREIAELPQKLEESGIKAGNVETNVPTPKPFLTLGPGAVGFGKPAPRVHALWHGRPLCGFSSELPKDWPPGHKWVGPDDTANITCAGCKTAAELRPSA